MSRIGIAMVGLGPASQPHVKSLRDLADRVDVRWVVTRSAQRAAAFDAGFPVTTDVSKAIDDPAVAAVLVLTPPGSHLDVARLAFARAKHVLVEKPPEIDGARARQLAAEGRAAGVRVGVVLQHRFRQGGEAMRDLIASGRLGEVAAASVFVPWWRPQAYYDEPGRGTMARDGGGVLLTQAIHTFDLFRWLVGVRAVKAAHVETTPVHRMETEDYASALLELGNGAPGTLVATTACYPGRQERIDVIGTRGSALLEGNSLRAAFHDGTTLEVISDARTGSGANVMDFDHGPHRAVLADFLDAIEQRREPRANAEDALATQLLIEEIVTRGSK